MENRADTEQVQVDGTSSEAILRALVDDVSEDFEEFVEEELGAELKSRKFVGFGVEVEVW